MVYVCRSEVNFVESDLAGNLAGWTDGGCEMPLCCLLPSYLVLPDHSPGRPQCCSALAQHVTDGKTA